MNRKVIPFQQDNATPQTSGITEDWFSANGFIFETIKKMASSESKLEPNIMKKKSLHCLNCATFRKLSDYNMRKKSLNFLNVAQLRQCSDFFIIVQLNTSGTS